MATTRAEYATGVLIRWVRENAPDLRIVKTIIDGKRWVGARFSFDGAEHTFESGSDDPEADVALQCAEAMRRGMHLPPLVGVSKARELEESILRASLAGDTETADRLARELVLERAQHPSQLYGRTSFGKRSI